MELRALGQCGLHVSVLSFGTMTFGGAGLFQAVGRTGQDEADRLVGLCLDAGVTLFDTADGYSDGESERILGRALTGRRDRAILATKVFSRMGESFNDGGTSRYHMIRACEASLRRLGTDHIDLYQMHQMDPLTPIDETLRAADDLVRTGKVRYVGCSNFGGWELMKALGRSAALGLERFVSHQIHYSLASRDAEWDLIPVARDQGVGILIWGPLFNGLLTGKFRRDGTGPQEARAALMPFLPIQADRDRLFRIVDVLAALAEARSVPIVQVALNYLLLKPGVTSVIVGARNEAQLVANLGAAGWRLSAEEVAQLDQVSEVPLPYPHVLYRGAMAEASPFSRKPPEA